MQTIGYIVWAATLFSNAVLFTLLTWREWYIRYRWLTVAALASVLADLILLNAHSHIHPQYEAVRHYIFYVVFWLFDANIVWESFRLHNPRVTIPAEVHLGMSLLAALLHRTDFLWTTWYIEWLLHLVNLGVIVWFITIFSKEPSHDRQQRTD